MKHKSIKNLYINNPSVSVLQSKLLFINGNIPLKARLYSSISVIQYWIIPLKEYQSCSIQSWPKFGYSKHIVCNHFCMDLCFYPYFVFWLSFIFFFKCYYLCKYCCHLYIVILCAILCHVKSDSRLWIFNNADYQLNWAWLCKFCRCSSYFFIFFSFFSFKVFY